MKARNRQRSLARAAWVAGALALATGTFPRHEARGDSGGAAVQTKKKPAARRVYAHTGAQTSAESAATSHSAAHPATRALTQAGSTSTSQARRDVTPRRNPLLASMHGTPMHLRKRLVPTQLSIESWLEVDDPVKPRISIDPIRFSITGGEPGDTYSLAIQQPSAPIELDLNAEDLTMQQLRTAVRDALSYREVLRGTIGDDQSPSFVDAYGRGTAPRTDGESGIEVPVHAPIMATTYDARGRRTGFARAIVKGSAFERTAQRTVKSGLFQVHYQPWITERNVWLSTPFVPDPQQPPRHRLPTWSRARYASRLLALAAFPANTRITLRNQATGEEIRAVTSDTGSLDVMLPVDAPDTKFSLRVYQDGAAGAAYDSELEREFHIPKVGLDDRVLRLARARFVGEPTRKSPTRRDLPSLTEAAGPVYALARAEGERFGLKVDTLGTGRISLVGDSRGYNAELTKFLQRDPAGRLLEHYMASHGLTELVIRTDRTLEEQD